MKQYINLMKKVLKEGEVSEDRTGTGTIGLVGEQLRFNLKEGFPLYTTKKMFTRGIVHELIWFLKGETNTRYLNDSGVHIWDDWLKKDFNIGGLSNLRPVVKVKYPIIEDTCFTKDVSKFPTEANNPVLEPVYGFYCKMLELVKNNGYSVDSRYSNYLRFFGNVKELVNYRKAVESPDDYVLTSVYYGVKKLCKETLVFLHKEELSLYIDHEHNFKSCFVLKKDGNKVREFIINSPHLQTKSYDLEAIEPNEFTTKDNLDFIYRYSLGTGEVGPIYPYQWRNVNGVDQIANVVNELRTNPSSRRILVDSWDVNALHDMALPPCHVLFQFISKKGKLSLSLYQRSNDLPLGNPFNVAQYAMLLVMVAKVTNLIPHELIITIGDAHIYLNQMEGVKEQVKRIPMSLCSFEYNGYWDGKLQDFVHDVNDFVFKGYESHDSIKYPVAI